MSLVFDLNERNGFVAVLIRQAHRTLNLRVYRLPGEQRSGSIYQRPKTKDPRPKTKDLILQGPAWHSDHQLEAERGLLFQVDQGVR